MARNMATQQAAINLARMANKEQDIDFGEGKLDVLLLTLTVRLVVPHLHCVRSSALIRLKQAEADKDVTTAMDKAEPPAINTQEREQLLMLQKLIARRLKG